jgi:hypothetical protein
MCARNVRSSAMHWTMHWTRLLCYGDGSNGLDYAYYYHITQKDNSVFPMCAQNERGNWVLVIVSLWRETVCVMFA